MAVSPEELPGLLARGLAMAQQRLAANGAGIHASVRAQLLAIRAVLDSGAPPTAELLDRLTLGVYAAREFETADPDYADVLFKVEYLAKRL